MSKKFKKSSSNEKRCSSFKDTIFQRINALLEPHGYYATIGDAIQHLHEDKKIENMCRSFIMSDIRRSFKPKPLGEDCSSIELNQYSQHSEYQSATIRADISTGNYMHRHGISYNILDAFANKLDYSANYNKPKLSHIPNTLQHVWLTTNKPGSKKISDMDIKNIVSNRKLFEMNGDDWEQIIWTNDYSIISQAAKFRKNEIEVRSIDSLDFQDSYSKELVTKLSKSKAFGMASDLLRYEIIASNGGVYADFNFKFNEPIAEYMDKYDFFCIDGQNNFFAAKPHHKILEETIKITLDNMRVHPEYISSPKGKTVTATHHPFVEAIIKFSNTDGNVDFLTDYHYFYDLGDTEPLGIDNAYGVGQSWAQD